MIFISSLLQEMWVARLPWCYPRDGTSEMQSGGKFRHGLEETELSAGGNEFITTVRQADIALFVPPLPKTFFEYLRVRIDRARANLLEQGQKSTRVIIVPMTEDDRIDPVRFVTKGRQVLE